MISAADSGHRPLVTTAMAAYSLGMTPASFRSWARRHGITAADYRRAPGSTGQATALWDLADLRKVVLKDAA
ncbi:hypothetical protein OG393_30945 [Streptomyces sp. NBC_01216]|uniref:hypothetical protein n=1 Tax=Streptomyces sp. NBC_01216 TaxID=2903778 RepID=UPI002E11587E|nr:hypothetical protein OG393_30945 [Streptomyces sp. NBC_01216]